MAYFSPRSKSASTVANLTSSPSPSASCQVLSFNAPVNQSGCNPNPNCSAGVGARVTFGMNATFGSSDTAACSQCEYRQLVKGSFMGVNIDGGEYWYDKYLAPDVVLSETVYQEDGGYIPVDGVWGWARYGHRADPSGMWTNVIDSYGADRETGCSYQGGDAPSTCWSIAAGFLQYQMSLSFQGQIVQMPCDTPTAYPPGNSVVSYKNWEVYCSNID